MNLQLLRPEDIPALTHIRLGIVGQNGTGKTTWATTIPAKDALGNDHRVLYVSVDIENIRAVTKIKHYVPAKLNHWNGMLDLYDRVQASLQSKNPVTDLVFDTWSRMQDLAIGKVTGYNPADPAKLRQYIDAIPKRPDGWKGWGQVGSLMNEWMANFNRLPINVYYLMQEMNREEKYDESLETGPRLTPEAAKGVKDALEVIGRLYVEVAGDEVTPVAAQVSEEQADAMMKSLVSSTRRKINPDAIEVRKLFVGKDDRYFAKGPTHLLGRIVEDPTWDRVVLPILTQTPLRKAPQPDKNGAPPSPTPTTLMSADLLSS